MSVLNEIAQKLHDEGIAVKDVTLFWSSKAVLPDGDGPFLVMSETGGVGPGGFRGEGGRTQNQDSVSTQHPTVQVVAIGDDEELTRTLSKAAYSSLDGTWNKTLSGTFYLSITARQEPTDTGLDGKGRIRFTFNIDIEKGPS